MNKTITLLLGAMLVIGLAAGGYFILRSNTSTQESASTTNEMPNTEDPSMMDADSYSLTGNFADLIKLGKNFQCEFDYSDDSGNMSSGTVYVESAGDKLYGDFQMTQPDGTSMSSNILRDGEYNYFWSSDLTEGYKFKIDQDQEASFWGSYEGENSDSMNFNPDENVDFDCERWDVEESLFNPPSNVDFMDVSSMMMELEESQESYMEDACSACDQVPAGAARDQCLQALDC